MVEPYIYQTQVRFSDTDLYGIVHHASYFKLLEEARFQLVEDVLDLSLDKLKREELTFPVTNISGKYKKSLMAREKVSVNTIMYYNTSSKFVFQYKILNEKKEVCFVGSTEHVCLVKQQFTLKLPDILQKCIQEKEKDGELIGIRYKE